MICRANENDVGGQEEEENRGSTVNQQSRELVKKWVRYVENKMETPKIDRVMEEDPGHQWGWLRGRNGRFLGALSNAYISAHIGSKALM